MLHRPLGEISYDAITAAVGQSAADCDRSGRFPNLAFAHLRRIGLIGYAMPGSGDPVNLFHALAAVGHGDLSVGRIFEGHVNALFLIERFGTLAQRERYQQRASDGQLFGVWNTDVPGEAVKLVGSRLEGKKNFASGVDGLNHAIITAAAPEGRLMVIVPVSGLPVDRSWWRPLGMRASGSHVVDFNGRKIEADWILGGPDDYIREPWFSAGAIRFAAVQIGGMHAIFDAAVTHLRATNRVGDPYQRHHIGRMGITVESGYAWLDRAAKFWAEAELSGAPGAGAAIIAVANATRLAVESQALIALEVAERSVGAGGMIAPHPLERLVRDLRTYLRQPNPDGALASLGSAIAEGNWTPGICC